MTVTPMGAAIMAGCAILAGGIAWCLYLAGRWAVTRAVRAVADRARARNEPATAVHREGERSVERI